MQTKTFNVKDEGLNEFFNKYGVEKVDDRDRNYPSPSVYHLMRDKIYLKKTSDLVNGQVVKFELRDVGRASGKELFNVYEYAVDDYDDVCYELSLIAFNVYNR